MKISFLEKVSNDKTLIVIKLYKYYDTIPHGSLKTC